MKYVLLLRHAKSLHDSGMEDVERPLDGQGKKDARLMGKFLEKIEYLPGHVISSPAERALDTTRRFMEAAGLNREVSVDRDLYYGSVMSYVNAIREYEGTADIILLTGHNPLIEHTISELCGSEGDVAVRMPAGALACLEHPALRWEMVLSGTARLKWLMIPEQVSKLF